MNHAKAAVCVMAHGVHKECAEGISNEEWAVPKPVSFINSWRSYQSNFSHEPQGTMSVLVTSTLETSQDHQSARDPRQVGGLVLRQALSEVLPVQIHEALASLSI